jgi:hypothetical protein
MSRFLLVLIVICVCAGTGFSQRLTALHGSSYAGTTGNDYNPATVVNQPNRWDLLVFGLQYRSITNRINFTNTGLLRPKSSPRHINEGTVERSIEAANTFQLLHFSYKPDDEQAISIGFNVRSYFHSHSGPAFFSDQVRTVKDFIVANAAKSTYYGNLQTDNWAEMLLGYSRVLHSDEGGAFHAGFNIKIMRALAGAYGVSNRIDIGRNGTTFALTNADGTYAHAASLDDFFGADNKSLSSLFRNGKTSLGLNLGVEYISRNGNEQDDIDYNWKAGISLMDLGKNTYQYSKFSFRSAGVKTPIDANRFDYFIKNVSGFQQLQDTLRQWVNTYDTLRGNFSLNNPTRVIVNVDKSFQNNFFVNAEVQLNLRSTTDMSSANTRELSLLTITPRWEKKTWGIYLPVQYNYGKNFWVGGAVKAGPLMMGVDNLGWIFGKKSVPNGGFYLGLHISGGDSEGGDKGIPCPKL